MTDHFAAQMRAAAKSRVNRQYARSRALENVEQRTAGLARSAPAVAVPRPGEARERRLCYDREIWGPTRAGALCPPDSEYAAKAATARSYGPPGCDPGGELPRLSRWCRQVGSTRRIRAAASDQHRPVGGPRADLVLGCRQPDRQVSQHRCRYRRRGDDHQARQRRDDELRRSRRPAGADLARAARLPPKRGQDIPEGDRPRCRRRCRARTRRPARAGGADGAKPRGRSGGRTGRRGKPGVPPKVESTVRPRPTPECSSRSGSIGDDDGLLGAMQRGLRSAGLAVAHVTSPCAGRSWRSAQIGGGRAEGWLTASSGAADHRGVFCRSCACMPT